MHSHDQGAHFIIGAIQVRTERVSTTKFRYLEGTDLVTGPVATAPGSDFCPEYTRLLFHSMSAAEPRALVITRVRQQGREIRSFNLMPEDARGSHNVSFIPGQVAILRVGNEESAYFAFAGAPEDPELEILVKRTVGASVALFDMNEGARVDLLGVAGLGFDLDAQQGRDLVFVAMGTGVAPLRSALRHVMNRKNQFGQMVVLYGVRTPDDFCYRDEIAQWEQAGAELRQVISRPDGHDWSGPTGYVQSLLDHVLADLKSPIALVCGSREMIAQTRDRLQRMGFAPQDILTNY